MTRFRLFGHSFENGLLDVHRQLRVELSWSGWLFGQMLEHISNHIRSGEWSLASQEFIGNTAERILVTCFARRPAKLLRGHVWRSASDGALANTDGIKHFGNAKVSKECFTFGVEENIFRFEVAMNDILLVGMLERLSDQ